MADANAEMLEQAARYPRIRDRSLFLGEESDLPDSVLGDGLPRIRDWAANRFIFTGRSARGSIELIADRLAELL